MIESELSSITTMSRLADYFFQRQTGTVVLSADDAAHISTLLQTFEEQKEHSCLVCGGHALLVCPQCLIEEDVIRPDISLDVSDIRMEMLETDIKNGKFRS